MGSRDLDVQDLSNNPLRGQPDGIDDPVSRGPSRGHGCVTPRGSIEKNGDPAADELLILLESDAVLELKKL